MAGKVNYQQTPGYHRARRVYLRPDVSDLVTRALDPMLEGVLRCNLQSSRLSARKSDKGAQSSQTSGGVNSSPPRIREKTRRWTYVCDIDGGNVEQSRNLNSPPQSPPPVNWMRSAEYCSDEAVVEYGNHGNNPVSILEAENWALRGDDTGSGHFGIGRITPK